MSRARPLVFQLDFRSGVPAYVQIARHVERQAVSGRLTPGDQLPTVRELAVELGALGDSYFMTQLTGAEPRRTHLERVDRAVEVAEERVRQTGGQTAGDYTKCGNDLEEDDIRRRHERNAEDRRRRRQDQIRDGNGEQKTDDDPQTRSERSIGLGPLFDGVGGHCRRDWWGRRVRDPFRSSIGIWTR